YRPPRPALDRPGRVLLPAGRAAEAEPADDGGLVPQRRAAAAALPGGAGGAGYHLRADRADPAAARLRHRDAGRRERRVRAVPGGAVVVVVRRRVRGPRGGRAGGVVLGAQAVPEGPHPHLLGPGVGSAWRRLEHHPVEDRDRRRRADREGLAAGLAVAPG